MEATITKRPEFRWVAGAAASHKDGRMVLQQVKVEPNAMIACDGFRLRYAVATTGETGFVQATPKHYQMLDHDGGVYPDYERLIPRDILGTCTIGDEGNAQIITLIDTLESRMDATERRRRIDNRRYPIIQFYRDEDGAMWLSGDLFGTNYDRDIIRVPFAGTYESAHIDHFAIAFNGQMLREAIAVAGRFDWAGKTQPAIFRGTFGYEILMPMYINW